MKIRQIFFLHNYCESSEKVLQKNRVQKIMRIKNFIIKAKLQKKVLQKIVYEKLCELKIS